MGEKKHLLLALFRHLTRSPRWSLWACDLEQMQEFVVLLLLLRCLALTRTSTRARPPPRSIRATELHTLELRFVVLLLLLRCAFALGTKRRKRARRTK